MTNQLLKLVATVCFAMLVCSTVNSQSTEHFVTTWDTRLIDSDDTLSITIPTDTNFVYNYDVDWDNDGIFDSMGITSHVRNVYPQSGIYTIRIRGDFPKIAFSTTEDRVKITSIDQWGAIQWKDMSSSFFGTVNMSIPATDAPDLSDVTDLSEMFRFCNGITDESFAHWNTQTITDMSRTFLGATFFDGDISTWDVSNVTNLRACFFLAEEFNNDIGKWDVSKVEDMESMFYTACNFNQDISQWDVSNVRDMETMFIFAFAFNQDLNDWDVSNVIDMRQMFYDCRSFNQDLDKWDVSSVEDMQGMFQFAEIFNGDITTWDVRSVEQMQGMFQWAYKFNRDISGWNVQEVEQAANMFRYASSFDQDLGPWQLTSIRNIRSMLDASGLSIINYDKTLQGWSEHPPERMGLRIGCDSLYYCDGEAARERLITEYGWTFEGDQRDCSVGSEDYYTNYKTVIYPNPSTGIFKILDNPLLDNHNSYEIYNLSGSKICTAIPTRRHSYDIIDLSFLPVGTYILSSADPTNFMSEKVIIR